MKLSKNILFGGVLASALVLGACGANASADDMEWETEAAAGSGDTDPVDNIALKDAFKDNKSAEAIEIAHENFDGILEGISYEEDDGVYYYEVKFENSTNEYEVKLNADDLTVIDEENDNENDERGFKRLEAAQNDKIISLTAAKEAAEAAAEGEADQWDYDVDDFKYEFEIGEFEVTINAKTGDVTEIDD